MRYGLVGTGYWAARVHARALATAPGVELAGVWGRDADKTAALATERGTVAYDDPDRMFADVEAVAFAVPPDVQAPLAVRAASAGCHLLLEKPIALDLDAADAVVEAATAARVSSVVFLTSRFVPAITDWIDAARTTGGWMGAQGTQLAALDAPGNPFAHSPWRREHGALWDIGPHMLSVVLPILGPVAQVRAARGPGDTVHVFLRHADGASSALVLSFSAPEAAVSKHVSLYGATGWRHLPDEIAVDAVEALSVAVAALATAARTHTRHPCDVTFGREIVEILAKVRDDLG